jgi:demethylmenaquinone methyltransferase/2-methoxy-6-polyprenyl-1,4-benzoquinol methylase
MNSKPSLASDEGRAEIPGMPGEFGAGPTGSGKADRVREMFAQIAPRYDLLNRVLSLGIDRRWRKLTVRELADVLDRHQSLAADLCCGTGDLLAEIASRATCFGLDFCHPMLVLGQKKTASVRFPASLLEGDALNTPFPDCTFDAVTIAFGLRNLESVTRGLDEIYRILKPGGRAAILEFSKPVIPLFRGLFGFYFGHILPRIGNAVSGSSFAYSYLHASVKEFPDQARLAGTMRHVGFSRVTYYNLTGGIAALHLGDRP